MSLFLSCLMYLSNSATVASAIPASVLLPRCTLPPILMPLLPSLSLVWRSGCREVGLLSFLLDVLDGSTVSLPLHPLRSHSISPQLWSPFLYCQFVFVPFKHPLFAVGVSLSLSRQRDSLATRHSSSACPPLLTLLFYLVVVAVALS